MSDDEILAALYNRFDPIKAADDAFYVDCTDVRGGTVFASKLCDEVAVSNGYLHALFTGHSGCGKSSELTHLRRQLDAKTPLPPRRRLLAIVIDMIEYLDENDVSVTEILLAIVAELADALRVQGIELKDSYLTKRIGELRSILLSDYGVGEAVLTLGNLKMTLPRLRTAPEAREQVRAALRPKMTGLLVEINEIFDAARLWLRAAQSAHDGGGPYFDFVLILDNLEKVQRFAGVASGEATLEVSQRALFIDGAAQFTALNAHVVFTVPLSLVRASGPHLTHLYGREPFVLPMVKTEERQSHARYQAGHDRLTTIIQRRVASTGRSVADLFQPDALDFLLAYSGGHVRSLMLFVREASLASKGSLPIPLRAAQRAIAQTVGLLSAAMRPEDWEALARLERSEDQDWDNNDAERRRLLDLTSVLEYINGGHEDPFNTAAPWYAVHPIIRELRQFKHALSRLDRDASVTPPAGNGDAPTHV
jgi:hypothetical protein